MKKKVNMLYLEKQLTNIIHNNNIDYIMKNKTVGFHHGALADTYEEQANQQGFTFGEEAEWVEKVGDGLKCLWIHGCMTDKEYDRILQRFQKKILVKFLKRLEVQDDTR